MSVCIVNSKYFCPKCTGLCQALSELEAKVDLNYLCRNCVRVLRSAYIGVPKVRVTKVKEEE
jgi:hypothetical protein